jgi:nucleoside-diphosphate-sugar epimerase
MRVLITGGTGLIGKATVERLLHNGHDVRVVDLKPDGEIKGAEYIQGNILEYDDLLQHMRGCDAVIHLAAIRAPILAPGHEVFQVNVAGTFNVFEAAAASGIRRVVQASSINAFGNFYSIVELEPQYLPMDEAHPRLTTDPYSLSKQMDEDIGEYYWRREGISSVALRFPAVYVQGYTESDAYLQKRDATHKALDELVSQPESEQQARIADVRRRTLEFREQRPLEFAPGREWPFKSPVFDDVLYRTYASDRFNLWAFVDERDAAQSLEKGITADYEGAHALFINDPCNFYGYDTQTLIRLFFPEVKQFRSDLSGAHALVSIERARQLIGFEPEYSIGR